MKRSHSVCFFRAGAIPVARLMIPEKRMTFSVFSKIKSKIKIKSKNKIKSKSKKTRWIVTMKLGNALFKGNNNMRIRAGYVVLILIVSMFSGYAGEPVYSWNPDPETSDSAQDLVQVPDGFQRISLKEGSFGAWLRNLPLKTEDNTVYLFDGRKKRNQRAQFAVVDIDVGTRNLQQCADAVMRLRAEYLFSRELYSEIVFKFTSGDPCPFSKWADGFRTRVSGNQVAWSKRARRDTSHETFRKYMNTVFTYAGSYSLEKELRSQPVKAIAPGNVFIFGGFPGHAMLVLDVAVNSHTGEKIFLLLQSYMPAQNMHIVQNPINSKLNPWFSVNFGEKLITPEWTFEADQLRKF